jgi:sterol desaturase/sphingolipid hydroxylase (fatty acid hydroxylase superfamily)
MLFQITCFAQHVFFYITTIVITNKFPRKKPTLTKLKMMPIVFNNFLLTFLFISFYEKYTIVNYTLDITDIFKIPIIMFILNINFTFTHYILHKNKLLYSNIHYIHHQLKITDGFGALYSHPIEHIFGNILSMALPIYLCNLNYTSMCIFINIATIQTVWGHVHFSNKTGSTGCPCHI